MAMAEGGGRLLTQEIRERIRDQVIHILKPGDLLPSQPVLRERFGIGAGTVTRALAELEKEGLVIRHHGRGTFVTDPSAPLIGITGEPSSAGQDVLARAAGECRLRFKPLEHGSRLPTVEDLLREGFRGLVSFGLTDSEQLDRLTRGGIRVVCTDWVPARSGLDMVGMDSFRAGLVATELLIKAGHERIAYVGFQPWAPSLKHYGLEYDVEMRRTGCEAALLSHGIQPDPALFVRLRLPSLFQKRADTFSAKNAFRQLFGRNKPPTALVLGDRSHAEAHVAPVLAAENLVIPSDLSVVTTDYLDKSGFFTTVGCSSAALVENAVELLLLRLSARLADKSLRLLVDVEVKEQETTAEPPKR